MRFVAEYLENTAQLLLRLLSIPSVPGDIVQIGTYLVDGTPQIPESLGFDVVSDDIKNGEAHIYLTGYWPLPPWVDVTLPDTSQQRVAVVQVTQHTSSWEPLLSEQSVDAIIPISPEDRRPGEGYNPYVAEATIPPEYPPLWIELSLERTDPLRLGADLSSDPLTYVGGGEGRALSSTQAQIAADAAPYLSYAPVRFEGQFTNSLLNSDFSLSPSWPSPHFDPLPNGWTVNLADPYSSIRMQTSAPGAVLPTFTLRYRGANANVSIPPVTILTPEVTNAGETFQIIIAPSTDNAPGRIQLKTIDDAITSPVYNLLSGVAILAILPIGTHTGRVKIVWDQQKGEGEEQLIQLIAPSSSVYTGGHSYIPTGKTSFTDVVTLNNIIFDKPWYFNKGSIRVDGSGESVSQPYSWSLKIGLQILLRVDSGVLSSDFMTGAPVTISTYLPSVLSYKLVWTSLTAFKLLDSSGMTSVAIPFALDLTAIAGVSTPLTLELMGYKPNEGSSIAKRWAFLPG